MVNVPFSMKVTIEAHTDVGRVRKLNEDSYRVVPDRNTIIVCDGMGGHAAGEVASSAAAETISDLMIEKPTSIADPIYARLDHPLPVDAVMLAGAVRVANRRLYNAAAHSNKLRGMGTTVVAALFTDGVVATAHVGDSRAYRISDGKIEQLTSDHSWIAELVQSGQVKPEDAESFADRNVITRALGTRPSVQVDVGLFPAHSGELYLLCSDGLCGYVSDAVILAQVTRHQDNIRAAARALIDAANAAGGLDNVTVALIRVDLEGETQEAFQTGTITLAEEGASDQEREDAIIKKRYPGDAKGFESVTRPAGATVGQVPPDAAVTEEAEATQAAAEADITAGFQWGWVFLAIIVLLTLATFVWPRFTGGPAEEDRNRPAGSQAPQGLPGTSASGEDPATGDASPTGPIVYLAAFGAHRNTGVYWDGVYQGRVKELEMGLMVTPGSHDLVVVSDEGDTVLSRRLSVEPGDTLDIVIK